MILPELDLGDFARMTLRPAPIDPRPGVISLPYGHLCPFCGVRPAGLGEGGCGEPDCRTAYLDADAAHERASDQ